MACLANSQHFVRIDNADEAPDLVAAILDAHKACVHGGIVTVSASMRSGPETDMNHFWADHLQGNTATRKHVITQKSLLNLISEINAFCGWSFPILELVQGPAFSDDRKTMYVSLKAIK